jgi:arginine-tRNA-protein transferase
MRTRFAIVTEPARCHYLPDRVWRFRQELVAEITAGEYMERLLQGWRRVGYVLFRPECASCRMCQSLRVPVGTFRASRSQRRAWSANQAEVSIRIGTPSITGAKFDLAEKFHRYQQETKAWSADGWGGLRMLVENPMPTEEWCYYAGDRLIGVGYVDALPEGLSAIYFFYDPGERHRSLGTYNILSIMAAARARGLPHVYLGYYVSGCRSLEYKGRFRPNEVIGADGQWRAFQPQREINGRPWSAGRSRRSTPPR